MVQHFGCFWYQLSACAHQLGIILICIQAHAPTDAKKQSSTRYFPYEFILNLGQYYLFSLCPQIHCV